jgi:hypothetical protein
MGALGAILAALFLVPPTKPVAPDKKRPFWLQLGALAAGGIGATLLLWLVSQAGISLSGTFGLLVGGYLMIWFAVAGVIATLLLSLPRRAEWLDWPGAKVLISGFLVATALWAGIGLLGGQIWLPWLLIPARLILWPVAIACLLPWFLAVGITGSPVRTWGRLGWWLANTLIIVGSLLLAMRLTPGLSFLVLILPVFPLILGAHALAAGRQRHVWAFTISAVLFISWALMAVFPLSM